MAPKNVFAAVVCAMLLGSVIPSAADEYCGDEFLSLDLSTAVLSPKRLGPPSQFAPVPVEAKADREPRGTQAQAEPKAAPAPAVRPARVAVLPVHKPRGAARTKLARRHGNPLDAQARDTRVQVWPCRSGGICNWK